MLRLARADIAPLAKGVFANLLVDEMSDVREQQFAATQRTIVVVVKKYSAPVDRFEFSNVGCRGFDGGNNVDVYAGNFFRLFHGSSFARLNSGLNRAQGIDRNSLTQLETFFGCSRSSPAVRCSGYGEFESGFCISA